MKASDVMTPHGVTVAPEYAAGDVADILVTHGISAVPVIEDGRLVGIISRADLIRALAVATPPQGRGPEDSTTLADALKSIDAEQWSGLLPTRGAGSEAPVELWNVPSPD